MPVGAGFIPARIGENKKMTEHKKLQPEIRFAGFTDDWEQCKLGDVVNIIMGQSPDSKNYTNNSSDHILVQGNADIKNGFVYPRVWTTQITKQGHSGDLIMSVRAPVGDIAKTEYDVVLGRGVCAIKGNEFIFQLLTKMKENDYWESLSTGSTFDSINSNDIKNAEIFIPSLEEQTQIGNFFKQLDDTIALHQGTLEKYQKLKVSYLEKMFPKENELYPELRFPNFTDAWEQRKLGEVVEFFSGLTYSPTDVLNNGTLVLRSSNIQDSQIVTDDNVYVRPECVYSQNVEIGDIVVVVRNGSKNLIGKHALVSKQMNNTVIGAFMTGIRSNNPSFFNALLDTSKFNDEIEKNLGATINQITTGAFKSMEFLIPSYEEQTQIGNFFKQLDDTIALHQREVEKYKKIKQSYLEKMFI